MNTTTSYTTIETHLAAQVAVIWLNRPDIRNALNDTLIAELTDAVERAGEDDEVRAIVLAGRGSAFCAGADLNWMKAVRHMTPEQIVADTSRLARLLRLLHESPKPTIARVHGPAFAGGLGLVAACDIAVAAHEATFCLSEVKLGLIPATIGPHVVRSMGERAAYRYMLTAEVFDTAEAYRIGFVQEIAPAAELDGTINAMLGRLMLAGPKALEATKQLIRDVANRPVDDTLAEDTARRIAAIRTSPEGQEGMASFLERRKPAWVPPEPGSAS